MFVQNTRCAVLEIKRENAVNKTYGCDQEWRSQVTCDWTLPVLTCSLLCVMNGRLRAAEYHVLNRSIDGEITQFHTSAVTLPVVRNTWELTPPCFSDACLCERMTFDSGGPCGRLCSQQPHQLPEHTVLDDASAPILSYNMKACRSPLCWSSRCSRRTGGTPALLYPTSGSECSSPLFLQHCCRWWATCGPPRSSGFIRAEVQSEFLKVLSKHLQF